MEPSQPEALVRPERASQPAGHLRLGGYGQRAELAPKAFYGGVHLAVVLFDPAIDSPELMRGKPRRAAVHHLRRLVGERLDG
ncbi:MAG: hypothetical protein M3O50_03645 [Myxococcota bacterium]|nr:hypothetical protein [Myxococcota bacterium]